MDIMHLFKWLINIYLDIYNIVIKLTKFLIIMDIRKIKKLIELVEQSNISKLEISEGKKSIRIMRTLSHESSDVASFTHKKTKILPLISDDYDNDHNDKSKEYIVRSPIVGIFYQALHATAEPFISIGQSINIGDTLCIIEAMKVMNHIKSDKTGIVQSILVTNGKPVEFDEPLLIIKQK